MTRSSAFILLMAIGVLHTAGAAEIQLRATAQPRGAVVRLGDMAQVVANDQEEAARLASIELFAAPTSGGKRFVRLREIQDALSLHGVALAELAFSGASQVAIGPDKPSIADKERPKTELTSAEAKRAERRVRDAILRHLWEDNGRVAGWEVSIELTDEQLLRLNRSRGEVAVASDGRVSPGEQEFELQGDGTDGPYQFSVKANLKAPPMVVVAVRALGRGVRIGEADVRLAQPGGSVSAEAFTDLDDVVGQETVQALSTDQPVLPEMIRAPLLVRRGEAVTVYARSPGLRVRTTARAREDGSSGDLVTVESLAGDRKTFFARVCGLQEVEVYARAVSTIEGSSR